MAASQVGMLRALVENGVRPDMVIGCSGGAFNGATFAEEPTLARLTRLAHFWTTTSARDILRRPWMSPAMALMGRGQGVHPADGLRQLLGRMIESEKFEELEVPFQCVATDVEAATERWFGEGPLADPVVASAATPVMFPPVEIDGRSYIDGGVVNDVPVLRAVELGARTIYVMEVGRLSRSWEEPSRPVRMAVEAYWVARRHRFQQELAAVPDDVTLHLLPHRSPRDLKFHDITRSAELIDGAYEATSDYLIAVSNRSVAPQAEC
jgi:NTE family protein